MKISELIAFLDNQKTKYGDVNIVVSIDISTGEDDFDARAFGEFIPEGLIDLNQLTLFAVGKINFND